MNTLDPVDVAVWWLGRPVSGADMRARVAVAAGAHTNVSHTASLTVLAVADVRVGVDIEIVRTHARLARLARRSMTDEEWLEWGAAADPARAFTQHWTRVEAYLKAIGVGLAGGLRTRPTDGWRVLGLELDATGAAANATHVGALAVESGARPVRVAWRDLATDERA